MNANLRPSKVTLPVFRSYAIESGRLVNATDKKGADFVLHSDMNLPRRLAAVRDEADLVAFAADYGNLRYGPTEDGAENGDPVSWALAHARQVEFVMRLLAVVSTPEGKRDETEMRGLLKGHWEIVRDPENGQAVGRLFTAIGLHGESGVLESLGGVDSAASLITVAYGAIAATINENLETARPLLEVELDQKGVPRFSSKTYIGTVIEDAYALLYEDVLGRTPYRICEDPKCNRPFRVTESHQRYCPNPDGGQSLCGTRKRTEDWRRDHPRQRKGSK